jgi:acetyl esterase/lipase
LLSGCTTTITNFLTAGVPRDQFGVVRNISYGAGRVHRLDIYEPAVPAKGHPVIVFQWGGSWINGSKDEYKFVAEPLAAHGITVVVPEIRLYPAVVYPHLADDTARAVAWTRGHIAQYGGDAKNLFVMGHSSGAYDAMMLAVDPHCLAEFGMRPGELSGVIGISGPYNFLPITVPELKPIFDVVSDLAVTQPITYVTGKNPPLLLLTGAADHTVDPEKNTIAFYDRVKERGGPAELRVYPDVGHVGIILAFSPLFRSHAPTLSDVLAFVAGHTK